MFEGDVWWITGASSGIGRGLARELAARGAALVLSGRNRPALEEVAKGCREALILPFEATDYEAIPAITERAWNWKGRVNALVNNAGISQRSLSVETEFSVYERIIAIDLLAPIALTQANLPRMVSSGGGQIVAISSVAGLFGAPLRSGYSAAKHGLIGYHDSVRCETSHMGISVLVVAPGSIRTNISRNSLLADGSRRGVSDAAIDGGMTVEDAASAILAAIESGQRELVLASNSELETVKLRRSNPDALFDRMAAVVQSGYAQKMKSDKGS